ncbi:precorrin-4 C(11)-methyltransferase [Paratractidigestivibacter sp.]|uniref:precorrin-4 C(11)-methyltransferase n=1 Tax=Paratractidigestivibacter sp. TaxID=2847316 RepID=UPI002ABDA3E1|nr:precorrin-4 C(11)-methyltransferase [Paratractidigestivibacter sp.]
MVNFVGAGSGAEDLITVRGQRLLSQADVVIWAGSLVNPALLDNCKPGCQIHDSAKMTLEEVVDVMVDAESQGLEVVRLHTGDPSIYGAIREQMDALDERGIGYEVCPGVSSFCGAAAALRAELTLPAVSQSVILTRLEGRTPKPAGEATRDLAAHGATMVVFLSAGMLADLQRELLAGGAYTEDTPAAIVYKATWPDERVMRCTVGTLAQTGEENDIHLTALVVVGSVLAGPYDHSKLYDPTYETLFRQASRS